jgi:hypothetical protein
MNIIDTKFQELVPQAFKFCHCAEPLGDKKQFVNFNRMCMACEQFWASNLEDGEHLHFLLKTPPEFCQYRSAVAE